MGALISGLLELLQWLAATFARLGGWLVDTVQRVAAWIWGVLDYALTWLWNAVVDVIVWAFNAFFWVLGHVLELPILALTLLVRILPQMPSDWVFVDNVLIPAFNVANQILPISEAVSILSLWLSFYGLMAVWRIITFIRGGR